MRNCSIQAVRATGSRARFVGVTGTNGKSTTTALIAHILALAGHGPWLPAAISVRRRIGTVTAGPQRIVRFGNVILHVGANRIVAVRCGRDAEPQPRSPGPPWRHGRVCRCQAGDLRPAGQIGDLAVVGMDDAPQPRYGGRTRRHHRLRRPCGRSVVRPRHAARRGWADPGHGGGGRAAIRAQRAECRRRRRRGAASAAWTGRPSAEGIRSFPGLPHRQQHVATVDGVRYVDDSKATNADAAAHALGCYDRIVWIAGGHQQGRRHRAAWPRYFPRVAHAVLIGRDGAELLAAQLGDVPHELSGTLDMAVPAARAAAARTGAGHRAAVAGLRLVRPVQPASRRAAAASPSWPGGSPDARAVPRRHLHARPLVVDDRPADPAGHRGADRLRLRHDAGGEPGGGRAHPCQPQQLPPQAGVLPAGRGGRGGERVAAVPQGRAAAGAGRLRRRPGC